MWWQTTNMFTMYALFWSHWTDGMRVYRHKSFRNTGIRSKYKGLTKSHPWVGGCTRDWRCWCHAVSTLRSFVGSSTLVGGWISYWSIRRCVSSSQTGSYCSNSTLINFDGRPITGMTVRIILCFHRNALTGNRRKYDPAIVRSAILWIRFSTEVKIGSLDIFLRYSTELGFFLHIPRFRHSMSLPKGSPERPSEGLISTVYLLGFHLSGLNVGDAQQREQAYLSRALLDVANILSSPHRDRTVHAIQAEILLAGHFFSTGRILEGKYHLHAALSITIAAKLHKIRSQNTDPGFPGMSSSDIFGNISQLDVPLDQIAEGERINAFWTTFTMSNCWAVAADSPQNFLVESFGPTVDTPWPLDMGGYEQVWLHIYRSTFRSLLQWISILGSLTL